MTKAEVITEIAHKTGIEEREIAKTLESFFTVVKESLAEGEGIYVRGFGSFINKKRAKRVVRNSSKNTVMVIDELFFPSFKPSKTFVEQVKNDLIPAGKVLQKGLLSETYRGKTVVAPVGGNKYSKPGFSVSIAIKTAVLADKLQIELYQHGADVFEDSSHFQTWLERPNAALSQQRPIDLIDTKEGVKEVDDLLTRLEYGVY